MDKDEQFKDYELANYTFIVVNKNTLTPLTWNFKDTKELGTLYYGKNKQYELKDPCEIGQLLSFYLSSRPQVPNGISLDTPNDIIEWIK